MTWHVCSRCRKHPPVAGSSLCRTCQVKPLARNLSATALQKRHAAAIREMRRQLELVEQREREREERENY